MIKKIDQKDEIIDFIWELSQSNVYASYPRRDSINRIKKEIEDGISLDNKNVIACYDEDILCGVCIYFWQCDEKYAQTTEFLIKKDYDKIAKEFIDYISEQLVGYELFIGVPLDNKNANQYFEKNNIECIEASFDTRLYNLEPHINEKHDFIEAITESNFEEYAIFHDKYAIPIDMYYNSTNLKKELDHFRIFAFRKDGTIHGSIFIYTAKHISEIFGMFIDEEYKNKGIESILVNEALAELYKEFGAIKEIFYFINEECTDELNVALEAGFKIKDRYRCYKYKF